jgi:uncharacterized protein (DUF302 family)
LTNHAPDLEQKETKEPQQGLAQQTSTRVDAYRKAGAYAGGFNSSFAPTVQRRSLLSRPIRGDMKSSIITRTTHAPLESVAARLPDIAKAHKFGVLGVHDLKEKMNSKGVPFDRECRVFEVCNPQQAQVILSGNISVSAGLPCRISVYAEGDRTVLATIEPAELFDLFGPVASGAEAVATEVRKELVAIMDEVCRDGGAAATTSGNSSP